ncbi:MAG: hypothetical protein AAF708_21800 [Deinococcota bacterium]
MPVLSRIKCLSLCLLSTILLTSTFAQETDVSLETLLSGGTTNAVTVLSDYITDNPADDEARFSLGVAHFLGAVEYLAQSWYRYGLNVDNLGMAAGVPFLRLPIPENPDPETFSNDEFVRVLEGMIARLEAADAALMNIDSDVKLVIQFDQLRLDLDGDGNAEEAERLWSIYARLNQLAMGMGDEPPALEIAFDQGDVHWLRGYSNLLAAMLETWLAVDNQAMFDNGAHLFFPDVDSPHDILQDEAILNDDFVPIDTNIIDAIALIYLSLSLDIDEPERLEKALDHLQETIAQSRLSWDAILAESDNDREWVPNSKQDSVVPAGIDAEMIEGWLMFLDEAEGILQGDILLPHWRVSDPNVGINFRRAFLETRNFDVILWIQGSAATPFLEEGTVTQPETWDRLNDLFNGNFVGFAVWIN